MLYQELIPLTALLQGQTHFPGLAWGAAHVSTSRWVRSGAPPSEVLRFQRPERLSLKPALWWRRRDVSWTEAGAHWGAGSQLPFQAHGLGSGLALDTYAASCRGRASTQGGPKVPPPTATVLGACSQKRTQRVRNLTVLISGEFALLRTSWTTTEVESLPLPSV